MNKNLFSIFSHSSSNFFLCCNIEQIYKTFHLISSSVAAATGHQTSTLGCTRSMHDTFFHFFLVFFSTPSHSSQSRKAAAANMKMSENEKESKNVMFEAFKIIIKFHAFKVEVETSGEQKRTNIESSKNKCLFIRSLLTREKFELFFSSFSFIVDGAEEEAAASEKRRNK